MKKLYENARFGKRITSPSYYRLSMPSLFPQYKRMIYLDGDTLIFEDLTELISLNMSGLYYRGLIDNNLDLLNTIYYLFLLFCL